MGRGSAGNVIAALCSFFIPGLGQLLQGSLVTGGVHVCPVDTVVGHFAGLGHPPVVHHRCRTLCATPGIQVLQVLPGQT